MAGDGSGFNPSLKKYALRTHRRLIGDGAGFTYVEMAVVVAIILVLSAVVLPRFGSVASGHSLRSSAAKIAGLINAARHASVAGRKTCRVVCAAGENRCDLECEARGREEKSGESEKELIRSCTWKYGTPAKALGSAPGKTAEKEAALIFHPDGSSEGPGLSISNDRGDMIIVEVFRATALPYVYEQAKK
ncbi:MAG: hypothetical protein ABIH66_05515 [bacterium]